MAYKKGKYNFTLDGVKYTDISGYIYEGDENKLNINVAGTASMVRQYIAAKYPKFYGRGISWVNSQNYSGGDSIRVYFNRIPLEYYEKISAELDSKFEEGSFNGMDDSYTYTKSAEKSNEGYIVDYGTKYLFVNNVPPYDAPEKDLPAPDWDKILSSSTPKPSTTSFKPKTSSSGSGFANKGQLLMTRAGWEFYKKKIEDGRIVYNLIILKDTPKNRGNWNEIKGEMYIDAGFKWGRYGNFERWGEIENENEVLEKAGAILSKYYTGKNQDLPKPSEEPQKDIKLKVGDKFYHQKDDNKIYTIVSIDSNNVKVGYIDYSNNYREANMDVDVSELQKYFDEGRYILIKEEPQTQSKESIEKAIKALQILANMGDESAKKQIISLKYLL
jgi:hypothetical protein